MNPARGYLLCCIERTGSTLLARTLTRTRIAGNPIEYFNPMMRNMPQIREILGEANVVEGLPKIMNAGTTPNGVFGAKIHWGHFRYLGLNVTGKWDETQRTAAFQLLQSQPSLLSKEDSCELLRLHFSDLSAQVSAYALLRTWLPDLRMIWLRRKNMVARAISLYRARQTNLWHKPVAKDVSDPIVKAPDFDFPQIHILYCMGYFQEGCWQRFFQQHEIAPHPVIYEELVTNYEDVVRGILEFLNLGDDETAIPPLNSRKQGDALSQEWEERYRKESAEAGLETPNS